MVVLRQKEQIQIWSPNAGFLNIHMKSMPTLASSQTQSSGPLTKTYTLSSTASSQPGFASSNPTCTGLAWVLPACPEWCVWMDPGWLMGRARRQQVWLCLQKKLQRFVISQHKREPWHHSDGHTAEMEGKMCWKEVRVNALIKVLIIYGPSIRAFF